LFAAASATRCYDLKKNIFADKFREIVWHFLAKNKAKLCKILVPEKNANFFAENCRKWQKIMINTSTPDFIDVLKRFSPRIFFVRNTVCFRAIRIKLFFLLEKLG
jgi:hypothetical protein